MLGGSGFKFIPMVADSMLSGLVDGVKMVEVLVVEGVLVDLLETEIVNVEVETELVLVIKLLSLFSCFSIFILGQAACVRHTCWRAPCVAWPLFSPTFALFSSSFFPLRLLLLTHFGESPMCEIIFHPIFWHN